MNSFHRLFFIALLPFLISSCASNTYYQVYKTETSDQLTQQEDVLVYEDENCRVMYNLWDEGGNIGFQFHNKTNLPITLHLDQSFFILNDIAYDYYQERVITHSVSSGASASTNSYSSSAVTGFNILNLLQTNRAASGTEIEKTTSAGESVAYQEEKSITIPAKTSKIITEYSINQNVLRNCDLFLYPKRRQVKTISFSQAGSPLEFSNRIAYSVDNEDDIIKFENSFYVSEISNYPEKEITDSESDEFCGEKSQVKGTYFKSVAPDKFYVRYTKDSKDSRKH